MVDVVGCCPFPLSTAIVIGCYWLRLYKNVVRHSRSFFRLSVQHNVLFFFSHVPATSCRSRDCHQTMSIRTFTVFQDTPSSGQLRTNSLRPNISTRSSTHNVTSSTVATGLNHLDKENIDPVTGEHAAPTKLAGQKRKTGILASKFQPSSGPKAATKELENKRRRPSPPSSSAEVKNRKHLKGSKSSKKGTKRAGLKKFATLPKLTEEQEVTRLLTTREELNSLCKELTVKPLADVSEAYDELNAFDSPLSASEDTEERAGVFTVKVRIEFALNMLNYLFTHASHIYSHHPWNLRSAISLSRQDPPFPLRQGLRVCGSVLQTLQIYAPSQPLNESRSTLPLYSLLLRLVGALAAARILTIYPLLKSLFRQAV